MIIIKIIKIKGRERTTGSSSSLSVPRGPPAAGRHAGRGEADRGVQAGQPRDVQLGDPGQAAEGRGVRPEHGPFR